MSTLRVNTIRAATPGGMITIGDSESTFVLPMGTTIGGVPAPVLTQTIAVAMSDEDTPLDSDTVAVATIHMPYDFIITGISAGVTEAHTGEDITISFTGLTYGTNDPVDTFTTLTIADGLTESTTPAEGTGTTQIPAGGIEIPEDRAITAMLGNLTDDGSGRGLKFYITGISK